MKPSAAHELPRRAWLASCGRCAALGALAVATGVLAGRGQIRRCPEATRACASCGWLPRCAVPRAATVRAAQALQEDR